MTGRHRAPEAGEFYVTAMDDAGAAILAAQTVRALAEFSDQPLPARWLIEQQPPAPTSLWKLLFGRPVLHTYRVTITPEDHDA